MGRGMTVLLDPAIIINDEQLKTVCFNLMCCEIYFQNIVYNELHRYGFVNINRLNYIGNDSENSTLTSAVFDFVLKIYERNITQIYVEIQHVEVLSKI